MNLEPGLTDTAFRLCHGAIVKGSRNGCIARSDALPGVQHMAVR
jgi:hypothetical protein